MSKYEKQAWAIGIYASLGVILLCIYHQPFVTDIFFRILAMMFFWFGLYIAYNLWRPSLKDITKTDFQVSYKATAWTFYGAFVISGILMVCLVPKEIKEISRDAIGITLIYASLIFVGVRFILLAYLLRKERLSRSEGYQPHPSPLPEGEGKNNNAT